MKTQKGFSPVTITLETQREIDVLTGLLRSSDIVHALKIPNWWEQLDPFSTPEATEFCDVVNKLLK